MSHIDEIVCKSIAGSGRFEQHWECVGVSPMHRALIHRLALAQTKKHHGNDHKIVWNSESSDVRWIDGDLFVKSLDSEDHCLSKIHRFGNSGETSMQILWCWNQPNWREFLKVTPWTVTGVVYNLATLRSWVSRCINSGKWQISKPADLPSVDLIL